MGSDAPQVTDLGQGGELLYWPAFVPGDEALMARLLAVLPLRAERVRVRGRWHEQPRRVSWHGPGPYTYSGLTLQPDPWCEELLALRARLGALLGQEPASVLVNHYRDGRDCVSWHADDEPEHGPDPTIASVSLGAARRFLLRPRRDPGGRKHELLLAGGSLLVMRGTVQRHWLHCVPRTARPVGPRLNLTWRPWCPPAGYCPS